MKEEKAVLVTTEYRGVFVGRLACIERDARRVTLTDCRNVIYWAGVKGFLGIAAYGPEGESRLGAVAPRVELSGTTSVTDMTDEAWDKCRAWD